MAEFTAKKFVYKTSIKWEAQKVGLLSSVDKPSFKVSTPPEFRGHPGIWTPEDLFVASVNSCIMTTFFFFLEKEGIELLHYESDAEGVLERVESKLMFSEIKVRPKIRIKAKNHVENIKKIIALSERYCLISNSIKVKIVILPEIEQEGG